MYFYLGLFSAFARLFVNHGWISGIEAEEIVRGGYFTCIKTSCAVFKLQCYLTCTSLATGKRGVEEGRGGREGGGERVEEGVSQAQEDAHRATADASGGRQLLQQGYADCSSSILLVCYVYSLCVIMF